MYIDCLLLRIRMKFQRLSWIHFQLVHVYKDFCFWWCFDSIDPIRLFDPHNRNSRLMFLKLIYFAKVAFFVHFFVLNNNKLGLEQSPDVYNRKLEKYVTVQITIFFLLELFCSCLNVKHLKGKYILDYSNCIHFFKVIKKAKNQECENIYDYLKIIVPFESKFYTKFIFL